MGDVAALLWWAELAAVYFRVTLASTRAAIGSRQQARGQRAAIECDGAPLAGLSGRGTRYRPQTRFIDIPAVLRRRSMSLGAICVSGKTSCAAPALMASRGMPKTTQLASSCA
jgi:hypothetical protein